MLLVKVEGEGALATMLDIGDPVEMLEADTELNTVVAALEVKLGKVVEDARGPDIEGVVLPLKEGVEIRLPPKLGEDGAVAATLN